MLEFAAHAGYEPGTNLRGDQAEVGWLFLLPRLDLGRVVLVGLPPAGTVLGLAAVAGDVLVTCASRAELERARRIAAERSLANVRAAIRAGDDPDRPAADLVYVTARELGRLARSERSLGALGDGLAAGAAIYLEPAPRAVEVAGRIGARVAVVIGPAGSAPPDAASVEQPAAWLLPAERNLHAGWTGRALSAARSAAPRARWAGPALTAARRSVARGGGDRRASAITGSLGLARVTGPPLSASTGGPAGVLAMTRTAPPQRAPDYLLAAARTAGFPLDDRPWRLAPPRGYRSQKVIFLLGDTTVVKLTQDPRFNPRLDNEFHTLRRLEERGLGGAVAAPRALFRGEHARLSIVGETRLAGQPFRERSTARPDCPVAAAALTAIADLGAASAATDGTDRRVFADLLARYVEIYRPGAAHERMLVAAVAALTDGDAELPAVFLHGDPTTLNLLVAGDRTIGMVDWENAEPAGPPLWDLFYFLHSYSGWAAGTRGQRHTPAAVCRDLLDPAGFGGLPVRAVEAYRRRLDLPPELVAPLFCTCWMYLALRQARQLAPAALDRGFYARVLAQLAAGDRRWPWRS